MNITDLIRDGILKIASRPYANWSDLETAVPLTVPLIAEDYPAKTAVMWNVAYEAFKMPDRNSMMLAEPRDVGRIVEAFRSDKRYRGGGAGVGFKEAIVPHLDSLTPLAEAIGAVNIVKKMPDGKLIGSNTDGIGYALALEKLFSSQGKKLQGANVLMLGAGGSGRAIAFALVQLGARMTILNRTPEKAGGLASALNKFAGAGVALGGGRELIAAALPLQDAVISVVDDAHSPLDEYAPLGDMPQSVSPGSIQLNREQTDALLKLAKPGLIVSDIRIRASETPMLAQAREHGLTVLDGIPMVVNQGVEAFWWLYQEALEEKNIQALDVHEIMSAAAGL